MRDVPVKRTFRRPVLCVVSGPEFIRIHFRAVSCSSLDDVNCNADVDAVLQVVVEDDAVDVSAEFGAVDINGC